MESHTAALTSVLPDPSPLFGIIHVACSSARSRSEFPAAGVGWTANGDASYSQTGIRSKQGR
jgi:hypothetical protein